MGVYLFDSSVFLNNTPGVVWLYTCTNPDDTSSDDTRLVRSSQSSRRASEPIDAAYVVGGVGYVTNLEFFDSGNVELGFATTFDDSDSGFEAGPQLTAAGQNIGIALRLNNGTVLKFPITDITTGDSTEPFRDPVPGVDATFTQALLDHPPIQCIFVDITHANIDWDNLRTVSAPLAPAAPTLTALPTSIEVTLAADPTSDATITSRDIQWRTGSGAWTEVTGVTSPHTITGLVEQTAYEVQWRAVSSAGDGTWSPSDSITTAAADLMPSLPPIFSQSATVGTFFTLTFTAATGGDPPLTYTVRDNPAWLTLSNRTLSGTPTAPGTHQVTVTVEDSDGDTAFRAFILTVVAAADLMPTLEAALSVQLAVAAPASLSVTPLELDDFVVPTGHEEADAALITSGLDANGW